MWCVSGDAIEAVTEREKAVEGLADARTELQDILNKAIPAVQWCKDTLATLVSLPGWEETYQADDSVFKDWPDGVDIAGLLAQLTTMKPKGKPKKKVAKKPKRKQPGKKVEKVTTDDSQFDESGEDEE